MAGLLIWAVYTFYYKDVANNDVHKFYNDAVVLHHVLYKDSKAFIQLMTGCETESTSVYTATMKNWERNFDEAPINENRTIIRLNALLLFFSFKTYFVHILFMCFVSLVGWVLFTNAVFPVGVTGSLLSLPVMLLPSVLFWVSGVMKEPVLVLGLGVFVGGLVNRNFGKQILLLLLGSLLIISAKFYVMACLLPATVAFLVFKNKKDVRVVAAKYPAVLTLFALVALNIQRVAPGVNPVQILVNKHTHSVKEAAYFNAGSRIEIPELTNATSVLKAIPAGIWNVLFRPYVWEGKHVMMLASALENVIVLAFVLYCLFGFKTGFIASGTKWSEAIKPLVGFVAAPDKREEDSVRNGLHFNLALFLLTTSVTYFALIGISTPVLGNIVRYKAPLLPFFLFAFILMANEKPVTRLNYLQREGA